jgi:hypothetical protein
MAWTIKDNDLGLPPITSVNTATGSLTQGATTVYPASAKPRIPGNLLCKEVEAFDPTYGNGTFKFLKGVASTAVGDWVGYSPALGTTVRAVANGTYPLAVAMSVCDTTTKYGWYQIEGTARANGLTSITHSSGFLALTGTAGSVDDASVIGDHVFNARKTTAVHVVGTFLDTYNISRPFTTNLVTVRN